MSSNMASTTALRASHAPRTGHTLPLVRRTARLAWRLAVLLGLTGSAFAQQHYWYDGETRRPLWIASDVVADLGKPEEIGRLFTGFLKYVHQERAAA